MKKYFSPIEYQYSEYGTLHFYPLTVDYDIPAEMCIYETLRAGVYGGVKEPMGKGVHMLHINTQKYNEASNIHTITYVTNWQTKGVT